MLRFGRFDAKKWWENWRESNNKNTCMFLEVENTQVPMPTRPWNPLEDDDVANLEMPHSPKESQELVPPMQEVCLSDLSMFEHWDWRYEEQKTYRIWFQDVKSYHKLSWYWQQPLWLSWWGPGLHRHKQKTMLLIQDLYMFDSMIQILSPRKTKHYRQRLELTWTTDVTSLRWSSHLVISSLRTMCLPFFPFFPRTIQASANALSCHLCPGHMPCQWWQTRYLKHHLIVQWHPRRQCLPWGKTWEVSFEVCKAENVPNPYRRLNATGR